MSFKVVAKRAVEIVAEFGPYHSFEDAKAEAQELADKMSEREDVDVFVLDPSAQDELGIGGPVAAHTHDELEHYGPELLGPQLREADNGFSRAPLRNTSYEQMAPYMTSSLAARKKVFEKIDSMPNTAQLMAYYHSQQDSIPKPWLHATDEKIEYMIENAEETFQKWAWSNHAADELAATASRAAERLGDTELAKTLRAEADRYYEIYENMAEWGLSLRHSGVVAEQGPYWPHEYVALGMTAPASPESLDWNTWHKEIKPRLKVLQNPTVRAAGRTRRFDGKDYGLWSRVLYKSMAEAIARRLREQDGRAARVTKETGEYTVWRGPKLKRNPERGPSASGANWNRLSWGWLYDNENDGVAFKVAEKPGPGFPLYTLTALTDNGVFKHKEPYQWRHPEGAFSAAKEWFPAMAGHPAFSDLTSNWLKLNPEQWLQEADQEIEDDGTQGAFTKQARRAGYKNTMEFARKVMAGWRSGKKTVYNKKTKKQQGITQKTMYRANFAINAQKRRRNPVPMDPVIATMIPGARRKMVRERAKHRSKRFDETRHIPESLPMTSAWYARFENEPWHHKVVRDGELLYDGPDHLRAADVYYAASQPRDDRTYTELFWWAQGPPKGAWNTPQVVKGSSGRGAKHLPRRPGGPSGISAQALSDRMMGTPWRRNPVDSGDGGYEEAADYLRSRYYIGPNDIELVEAWSQRIPGESPRELVDRLARKYDLDPGW